MLENLQKEVMEINNRILALCENDEKINKRYKGCQIYYSPFVKNPDFMIVGINPGSGYFREKGERIQSFEPIDNYKSMDVMGEELKLLFRMMNKEDLFEKSFITNTYFLSTDNQKELDNLLSLLPEIFKIEVKQKAAEWFKTLVEVVSPKIILCTAYKSFGFVNIFYDNGITINNQSEYFKEGKIGSIPIIACKRKYVTIENKQHLINRLTELL